MEKEAPLISLTDFLSDASTTFYFFSIKNAFQASDKFNRSILFSRALRSLCQNSMSRHKVKKNIHFDPSLFLHRKFCFGNYDLSIWAHIVKTRCTTGSTSNKITSFLFWRSLNIFEYIKNFIYSTVWTWPANLRRPEINQKKIEKIMTPPIIREAQFIVSGSTGETEGMQSTTPKKQAQRILMIFKGTPNLPRLKGPLGMVWRDQIRRHSKGSA